MSSRIRNEEKRAEHEAKEHQYYLDRQEQLNKQDNCSHYSCVVSRFNWNGKPVEVRCEECDAVNYIEENDE